MKFSCNHNQHIWMDMERHVNIRSVNPVFGKIGKWVISENT